MVIEQQYPKNKSFLLKGQKNKSMLVNIKTKKNGGSLLIYIDKIHMSNFCLLETEYRKQIRNPLLVMLLILGDIKVVLAQLVVYTHGSADIMIYTFSILIQLLENLVILGLFLQLTLLTMEVSPFHLLVGMFIVRTLIIFIKWIQKTHLVKKKSSKQLPWSHLHLIVLMGHLCALYWLQTVVYILQLVMELNT